MELPSRPETPAQGTNGVTAPPLGVARLRHLEGVLRALPGLYQESLHHISPVARRMHPTRVSGSRSRDRLNPSALDARHNMVAVLGSWAAFVVDERGGIAPAGSVPELADFLLSHLEWLAGQPPADDFAEEIEGLRRELLRTIDPEPGALSAPTWDCVVEDCSGTITAPGQSIRNTTGRSIRCSAGHTWELREWLVLRGLVERRGKAVGA